MRRKQISYGKQIKKDWDLKSSIINTMFFDLNDLLDVVPNLEWLEEPFMKEEIDNIIQNLPTDKS